MRVIVPDAITFPGKRGLFLELNTYEQTIWHLHLQDDKVITLFTEDIDRSHCLRIFGAWSKAVPSMRFNVSTGLRTPFRHPQDITEGTQ